MSASAFSIKDYKRDYWASLDKPYWSIFLLVFLIELVVIIYLQSLPVREMTQEEAMIQDIKKHITDKYEVMLY